MSKDDEIRSELLTGMREIIRYAVMTLGALPDPDGRYRRGLASYWPGIVHQVNEAYGYSSAWVQRFRPTPQHIDQMWVVMPWLSWIRREEGQEALDRIHFWALGGGNRKKLAEMEDCSPRTIANRIDRSIARLIFHLHGVDIPVERLEEKYKGVAYAMVWGERPNGDITTEIAPRKVYIGGKGLWKEGKYLRDGQWRADRLERKRHRA